MPTGTNADDQEGGVMYVTLKEYLAKLDTLESTKPEGQRRPVPTIVELAQAVGVHPITLNDYANNHIVRFNLKTGAKIIDELRRRGFRADVSDILAYRPASGES